MIVPKAPAQPAAVAHHYDELDAFYRTLWGEHLHHGLWRTGRESTDEATQHLIDLVAARARIEPGTAVCDVGTGYGGTARYLARVYGAQVTGLTLSPVQLASAQLYARPDGRPGPFFLQADWMDNPFPDATFDAVLAVESTEHMADKQRCFREAFRVLRAGGRLVVCAWLADAAAPAWAVRYLLEPICREGRLAGMGTAAEYRSYLEEAGFVVEQVADVSAQVRRTWAVIIARVARALATDPASRHYLLDHAQRERGFFGTVGRMWAGYRSGVLRYGILSAQRP